MEPVGKHVWMLRPDRTYNFAVHVKLMGCPEDEFHLNAANLHEANTILNGKSMLAKRDELYKRLTDAAEIVDQLQERGWKIDDSWCIWSNANEDSPNTSYVCYTRKDTAAAVFEALCPLGVVTLKKRIFIEVVYDDANTWIVHVGEAGLVVPVDVDTSLDRYQQAEQGRVLPFRPKS